MDANPFDVADEFCRLVQTPSLLDYLGVGPDGSSADALEKLKARRKHMQGMQSNPKYKKEALFLIKNFGALSDVLVDLRVYQDDISRRAESGNLHILELTLRGMVAGSKRITRDQEQFLRKNAKELRISEAAYTRLLKRLEVTVDEEEAPAYAQPLAIGGKVFTSVSSAAAVEQRRSSENETAPPVKQRVASASFSSEISAGKLLVGGEPVRRVLQGDPAPILIPVRNSGQGPLPGRVQATVPWLVPVQSRLDALVSHQTIEVRIAPGLAPASGRGAIDITTDSGGTARVEVEIIPRTRVPMWMIVAGVVAIVGVMVLAGAALLHFNRTTSLVVRVDPVGVVVVGGQERGVGTTVTVDQPDPGPVRVEVRGNPNFVPWARDVDVVPGEANVVDVALALTRELGPFPSGAGAACNDLAARHAVGERLPGLKRCVTPLPASADKVRVRVMMGADGFANAADFDGPALTPPVRECIARQVAALEVPTTSGLGCYVTFEIPRS